VTPKGVLHSGGSVDVSSGTGFSNKTGQSTPIVRLTVLPTGGVESVRDLRAKEARAIGLDLIAAASQAIADTNLRRLAKERGVDGDALVASLLDLTEQTLGEG
jgi:hypothetical protein